MLDNKGWRDRWEQKKKKKCQERGYLSLFAGSQNLIMYQDESTKVSMVSVSRFAAPPQLKEQLFCWVRKKKKERKKEKGRKILHRTLGIDPIVHMREGRLAKVA